MNQISPQDFKGVVLDSNTLLLFVIGNCKPELISRVNRLKDGNRKLTYEDYENILNIISRFRKITVTPNSLTEISNLIDKQQYEGQLLNHVAKLLKDNLIIEEYIPSIVPVGESYFLKFGLSDSVMIELAKKKYLILTIDRDLDGYMRGNDLPSFCYTDYLN